MLEAMIGPFILAIPKAERPIYLQKMAAIMVRIVEGDYNGALEYADHNGAKSFVETFLKYYDAE